MKCGGRPLLKKQKDFCRNRPVRDRVVEMPDFLPPADHELLTAYAERAEEGAFHAIVQRHSALVHGVAVRRTGDAALAEDVVQQVFLALARKARSLAGQVKLGGWLHRAAVMESPLA